MCMRVNALIGQRTLQKTVTKPVLLLPEEAFHSMQFCQQIGVPSRVYLLRDKSTCIHLLHHR